MIRIGITGHRLLSPATAITVERQIRDRLGRYSAPELIGISCLAESTDMIFADAVLESGGALEVILVEPAFYDGFSDATWRRFRALQGRASTVHQLPPAATRREAWHAAAAKLLNVVDLLMAVWDGRLPAGNAGTADVVAMAKSRGIPVDIIWPDVTSSDPMI